MIFGTYTVLFKMNPVILRTNQFLCKTKQVIFRKCQAICTTYLVTFRTNPVISRTNTVLFRTNPAIVCKNMEFITILFEHHASSAIKHLNICQSLQNLGWYEHPKQRDDQPTDNRQPKCRAYPGFFSQWLDFGKSWVWQLFDGPKQFSCSWI